MNLLWPFLEEKFLKNPQFRLLASFLLSKTESDPGKQFGLATTLFLRGLGFIYLVAFVSLTRQIIPLIGENGLLPAAHYIPKVVEYFGGTTAAFFQLPSVFYWAWGDSLQTVLGWLGIFLSLFMLFGVVNLPILIVQWAVYLSFCNIGQIFYGYGWESLLLESTFLAFFLVPLWKIRIPFKTQAATDPAPPPSKAVLWLIRWLAFRVMFGAGLIKLRGDPCWRDLSCLIYHYETQPIPNPMSWLYHQMPIWFHYGGVLFNHFVELIVPWFLLLGRRFRLWAGFFTVLFQIILIISGNLSWLNYLTLLVCIPCFDDRFLSGLIPTGIKKRFFFAPGAFGSKPISLLKSISPTKSIFNGRLIAVTGLTLLIGILSYFPVSNMFSPRQAMNRSFDPFRIVNTYGAFGSVGKVRREIVLQGTLDSILTPNTVWIDYDFKYKPGDPGRRPPIIAPYQPRLDWQIWFAAMQQPSQNPWLIHLIYKLLQNDPGVLRLIGNNPFQRTPPLNIRAQLFNYRFSRWGDGNPDWWERGLVGEYLPALSLDDPGLTAFLKANGFIK